MSLESRDSWRMVMFDGSRVEVYDELWGEDHGEYTKVGRTLAVWGRSASGEWLTRAEAQCSFGAGDIDVVVDNDGYLFVSEQGRAEAVARLSEAFPGADIHYYSEDEEDEGELDVDGIPPIFEVEFTIDRRKTD